MTEQYIDALKDYGLTENEINVYVTLLKIGEATAQSIAKQAGIPRTTTYHLLDSLLQKGLASFVEKGVIKYFQATPPERLVELLAEKKRRIEEIVPQLKKIALTIKEKPKVVVHEGSQGIKAILQDILDERKEILHYGDIISLQKVLPFAFPNFIRRRVEKKIPIRILCKREEPHKDLLKTAKKEYRSFAFIPNEYTFKTSIFLYANKAVILSLHTEPYFGIVISNNDYYQTQKNLFELLWKAYKNSDR
ncbi:TrmB family transcriptional regulator [Candidatus Woesearchaeota archaeon]|nr:TrmB family transcriptional regulator [Candidatus Woesearchaeota archaeon]